MPEKLETKFPKKIWPIGSITILLVLLTVALYLGLKEEDSNSKNGNSATNQPTYPVEPKSPTGSEVSWEWTGEKWTVSGTPIACPEPFFSTLPVNIDLVTGILYPGQFRGNDYKAHGGFRFDNSKNADITVTAPLDALVVEGVRYFQEGEIQYMFTFINSCGIAYRFDHLLTLSEKLQTLANELPEAREGSHTTRLNPPVKVSKGDILATAVGFVNSNNVFVDFGVYDLRAANQASKKADFAAKHTVFKQFIFYGVCWLNHLPTEISTKVKVLPAGGLEGKGSDYCV